MFERINFQKHPSKYDFEKMFLKIPKPTSFLKKKYFQKLYQQCAIANSEI